MLRLPSSLVASELSMGAVFALFAGFYYWVGKIFGRTYPETLGQIHFWITFFGVNLTSPLRSNNSIELSMTVCVIASTIPGISMNPILAIAQDTLF